MLLADSFIERNGTVFQVLATVLVAVVAGLGGWWLRSRNKQAKTFDYRVISDLPILSHRPDSAELKVSYKNREVQNPRIVRVKFTNTGNQVIKATDFLENYQINITGADLLDVSITDESARNLVENVFSYGHDPGKGAVVLTFNTLNAGDTFTVQMIVDSEDTPTIEISGRIEGWTRATKVQPSDKEINDISGNILGATFAVIVMGGLAATILNTATNTGGKLIGGIAVVCTIYMLATGIISHKRMKQRLERQ